MSNLNIDNELAKLSNKNQFGEMGLTRYKVARGDSELENAYFNSIFMDGNDIKPSNSPATTTLRTAGLPNSERCPFDRITFPTPDGVGYTFYICSTSSNDTSGGTGAREVYIDGLDANWDRMNETVVLNGTTGVATSNTNWLRINKMYVSAVGTSPYNEGDIYISTTNDFVSGVPQTDVINVIQLQYGLSTLGIFSVPRFYQLYFIGGSYYVDATAQNTLYNPQISTYPWNPSSPNDNRVSATIGALTVSSTIAYLTEASLPEFSSTDIEFGIQTKLSPFSRNSLLGKDDFVVNKFGRNDSVGTTFEDIWTTGGNYNFLTTAQTLEAISSSLNDDSTGTGARVITIEGLDANGDIIEEDITMNGTVATTATTLSFFRINRAFVKDCGTYGGANFGDITIRVSGGGSTLANIIGTGTIDTATYGYGQSQLGVYTVPNGYTGYLSHIIVSADASKTTNIQLVKRQNFTDTSVPVSSRRLIWETNLTQNSIEIDFEVLQQVDSLSDIWIRGKVDTGTSSITCGFDIILVKPQTNNYTVFWNTMLVRDPKTFG